MASVTPENRIHPRASTETDRRHLLADSVSPSESASIISDYTDGERTPRAHSPVRASVSGGSLSQVRIPAGQSHERRKTLADAAPASKPYRGFSSEAQYLEALQEWAEEKKYIYHDTRLTGFYGKTTMEEYASRPPVETGLKKKWKARKARKEEQKAERRNTVA